MIDKLSLLTDFLDSQGFKNTVCACVKKNGLLDNNYQLKLFNKHIPDAQVIIISIYVAKQTRIEVRINLNDLGKGIDFRNYVYKRIEEEINIARNNNDFYNKTLKTLMEYNQNNTEENSMNKTINDTEFENFVKETEAKADASIAELQAKASKEIENKRKECEEANKKDKAQAEANELRYFYDGLIKAGFTKSEAMSILLKRV